MAQWRCLGCSERYGAALSRCPRCRSSKGLVMALNVCEGCTARFAVGLKRCPQCSSKDFHEDGAGAVPKISRNGGASIADAGSAVEPEQSVVVEAPLAETVDTPEEPPVEQEGGEESSPGSSSSASSEKPESSPEPSETPTRSRARKTASRSKKAPTEGSSAPSTDGDQTADTSAADD